MSMIPISVDKRDYTGVIHNCSRFAQHCSGFGFGGIAKMQWYLK